MLRLKAGHRYRFYSVAVDQAGNRESAPTLLTRSKDLDPLEAPHS